MGDAKRRRDALARAQPWPRDLHRCPRCRSRRTAVSRAPGKLAMSHTPTLLGVCADCRTLWEAFPPDWKHDAVEAEPCDNCAFRQGSPESLDKPEWKALLAQLRAGQEFRCHKGAPILLGDGEPSIGFDDAWIRRHGRTCAGFLRMAWKWGDWLENRYGIIARPPAEAP